MMNWLQKISQVKPMALPFTVPQSDIFSGGVDAIDQEMLQETADQEVDRLNPEFLGSGSMGVAGITPEGLVVKYTAEHDEAHIAQHFMNNPIPCLPIIYEVKRLQQFLWAITMEKVKLLTNSEECQVITALNNQLQYSSSNSLKMIQELTSKYPYLEKLVDDYNTMMACLKEHKITPGDLHDDNVGYNKDGNLVLFDLG